MRIVKPYRGILAAAALACCAGVLAQAEEWPWFMGPRGDGTSTEKGLIRSWPAGGPKVLWRVSVGKGYGAAAIRDGEVFLMDRVGDRADALRCFDLETGREKWRFQYDAPGKLSHDGARTTPAVTDRFVFIIGPFGHFHCVDRKTHKAVWKKNLLADFGTKRPTWGVAQSPLLYNDMVIVAPQSKRIGLAAYDQATGKERWHSPPTGRMTYATPKLITLEGEKQATFISQEGVVAVDAETGRELWRYKHPCRIPVPNVSELGGGRLFVTGGYNAGSAFIDVSRRNGKWTVTEAAKIDKIGSHCHAGLVWQGHVYALCNTNERRDGLVCFDRNGKLLWQTKRNPNLDKGGSILTADGVIYIMDGRTGELYIMQPSPEKFIALDKAKLLSGREIWAPLALCDGRLVIRDHSQMKCVDLRAE